VFAPQPVRIARVQAKKVVSTLLKVAASAAMLGYLGYQASRDEQFWQLVTGHKNWLFAGLALLICTVDVTITILRWHMLVRTLGLNLPLRVALRAGFLAYLVNLLPFGVVGGDSLKAVMLIQREPKRKTEAVATVVVDRVIGLYSLLLLAAIASLFIPAEQLERLAAADRVTVLRLCKLVQLAAVTGTAGVTVLLIPGVTHLRVWDLLEAVPVVGGILHKLVGAMRMYRRRIDRLAIAAGVSLGIHLFYILSITFLTIALDVAPEHRPGLGPMFVIVPPSMIAGALPIGAFEVVLNLLIRSVSPPGAPQNVGFLLALAYRVIQICISMIGVGYWLTHRGEVDDLLQEAEEKDEHDELPPPA
jgi:uncharacterized protein (TIRG00374 family)